MFYTPLFKSWPDNENWTTHFIPFFGRAFAMEYSQRRKNTRTEAVALKVPREVSGPKKDETIEQL
jgi:hypothetical protein